MRNCCCSLFALLLLLLFLLHLLTTSDSPTFASFFRFLFNFVFILFDVARNSSRNRVGLLRQGVGNEATGFYSEEELLARNNRFFNVGEAGYRYEETLLDNSSVSTIITGLTVGNSSSSGSGGGGEHLRNKEDHS